MNQGLRCPMCGYPWDRWRCMTCGWKEPKRGLSRRRFLFLGASAAALAAAGPLVQLAGPAAPFPFRQLYCRIRISGAVIEASRHAGKGAFMAAWAKSCNDILQGIQRDEERAIISDGRRLQTFFLTKPGPGRILPDVMALPDEEHSIDTADWGPVRSLPLMDEQRPVDEKQWRALTMGSFETPQQPPVRRTSDPDIARFADDGGPV